MITALIITVIIQAITITVITVRTNNNYEDIYNAIRDGISDSNFNNQ